MKILVTVLCLKIVILSAQEDTTTEIPEAATEIPDLSVFDDSFDVLDIVQNNDNSSGYDLEDGNSVEDQVHVHTYLGTILGKSVLTGDGVEMHHYLGIPYAQPPVGQLRFQPPLPVNDLYDDFKAFNYGAMCPQKDITKNTGEVSGEEDCLTLNIFIKATNDTKLKPIMVFIHGGAFVIGSSETYDPTPLVREDVIVVTLNYRLGALGFLHFGNDVAPGNLGLRDQIQALKWIKMMSIYFGGDSSKITIFGESAGAISCHALTMSPKAYGLISAAIYESGTMLISREDFKTSKTYRAAQGIAGHFNCSSTNYDYNMLECLQQVSVEDLVSSASVDAPTGLAEEDDSTAWFPFVDMHSRDPVLPIDSLTAMKNGYFNHVPIMTGTVLNDGGLMYPEIEYGEMWESYGPKFLAIKGSFNLSETTHEEHLDAQLIKHFYTGENSNLLETLPEYTNMMTDSLFLSPDQKVAELASQFVPVYNYRFTFSGTHSFLPFYLAGREGDFGEETAKAFNNLKPVHADDLIYLFDLFALRTEEEMNVRDSMVKYWTNFAKYGHPSPLMSDNITQWLAYSSDKNYMLFDGSTQMKSNVEEERMAFWQKIHWNEKESKIEKVNIFKRAFLAVLSFFRGH